MSGTNLPKDEQDAFVSSTKIDPLRSPTKVHRPSDTYGGVIGEEEDIGHAHLQPLDSVEKHHHHTAPHANSQGVVGREDVIESSKIGPFNTEYKHHQHSHHTSGLDDETVDTSRITPLGSVREDGI